MARVTILGAVAPGMRTRADHEVGFARGVREVVAVRGQRVDTAIEDVVYLAEAIEIEIDQRDLGAEAQCDARRVGAHNTPTDDGDMRGGHAGDAAKENAAAAVFSLKVGRADLHAHSSGYFAHRSEKGQGALAVAHGFVGYADDL